MNRRERRQLQQRLKNQREHYYPDDTISDEELAAFAALHDTMKRQGFMWRMTLHPSGAMYLEVHCPAALDMPMQDIKVDATSITEGLNKLSEALIKVATEGMPQA